ncbi:MAG: DUF6298 domain-containing protein [Bacteroidales bacterium]
MKSLIIFLVVVMVAGPGCSPGNQNTTDKSREAGIIRPYPENPRYWEYKGEPVLLLGGSKDDNLFQDEDIEAHLDELQAIGGNYIRNTLSARDSGNVVRFLKQADGKYDLDQWNPEYWRRFENMLELTSERNIIVQLEIWDRFDYSRESWIVSPWNPGNNVNYTEEETGLAQIYPDHPGRDKQPFFHSVPGMRDYTDKLDKVRSYQEKYIIKLLSYSLYFGNVLYCMDNETSTPPEWGRYWMAFIDSISDEKGKQVYMTDMFDQFYTPQTCPSCLQVLENPDLYTFIDVSQINSRNFDQSHWDTLQWIIRAREKFPLRPVNNTKVYGGGNSTWGSGSNEDGVERFCRNVMGGCASARHHRPNTGNGLNDKSKASIKALRKVETLVKLWEVAPRMDLLSQRESDEAYLSAEEGEKYILYFTQGGAVNLDLKPYDKSYHLNWISVSSGEWGGEAAFRGGTSREITAPDQGGWFAVIKRDL